MLSNTLLILYLHILEKIHAWCDLNIWEGDIGLLFIPILLSYQNSYYRILCFPLHLYLVAFEQTRTLLSALTTQKHSMWLQHLYSPTNCSTASNVTLCRAEKKKRHQKNPSIDYSGRIKPPGTRQEHFCNWEQAKKARKVLPKKKLMIETTQ